MRFIASLVVVVLLACAYRCAGEDSADVGDKAKDPTVNDDKDLVVKLTDKTFDEHIKKNKMTLVEFFAPWCGHCKKLAPEYSRAAKKLSEKSIDVVLSSVDCTTQTELCKKMSIEGYPTLKIFKNGVASEYGGPREEEGIVKYLIKQIRPSVSELSLNELSTFVQDDDVVLAGSFAADSKELKLLNKVADRLNKENISFANIKTPSLTLFKKFDNKFAHYTGSLDDEEALVKWITAESTPLMAEISQAIYMKYIGLKEPMAYLFYETDEQRAKAGKIAESVMKDYKGKINAVYISAKTFPQHAVALNCEPNKFPAFVIHDVENDLKYPYPAKDELSESALAKFVKSFASGDLAPKYKSDPIPKSDDGPVRVVVNENFEKIVLDPKKDVLVEVYAPWCGVCKRVAPTYEKLGKAYAKHSDKILITKFNGDSNDLPKSAKLSVTGFPTFVLYKAGSNEKVQLTGLPDSVEGFVKFIEQNASNKVDVSKELKDLKEEKETGSKGASTKEKEEL